MPGESPTEGLLCPEGEQEVELLITDQATGISYSVSTQEFLVEDEQRLLDAFVPGPLMDTELLALDDAALKSQLMDAGMPVLTQCPGAGGNDTFRFLQAISQLSILIENSNVWFRSTSDGRCFSN